MFFNVEINPDDIEFKWSGYSDAIQGFIMQTITNMITMRTGKARDLEPMFNNAKSWLLRDWQGAQEEKTYRQALDLFPKMLYRVISREKDLHRMLENYKFSQFFRELQTWLHSGTVVWFLHGNFTHDQSLDIVHKARDLLNLEEVTVDQLAKVGPLILKEGTSTVYEERIGDK
jgi:secreted Zn-dependent insulinase-like peptidase